MVEVWILHFQVLIHWILEVGGRPTTRYHACDLHWWETWTISIVPMHADLFFFFEYVCVYLYCANWKWWRKDNLLFSMQSDFSTVVSNKTKKKQGLGDTDRGWGWFPGLRLNPGLKWDHTRCPIKSASGTDADLIGHEAAVWKYLGWETCRFCQWRPKSLWRKVWKA